MTQRTTHCRTTEENSSRVKGKFIFDIWKCCIHCGPDEDRILDVVPREDRARNSG